MKRGFNANSKSGPVTLSTRICYGIGEIPITVAMVLFGLFVLFFYSSVMKLPALLVGIAISCGLVWDAFIDPYIGYRSDRSTRRLGKRHFYMLLGALSMGAAFWLLLTPPRGLGTIGLFTWLLVTTVLFRFTSALYRIPYLSLGAEISQDYHERTLIVGIRSFFGLFGTLAAATLSFLLFFPNREPGVDPKLFYEGYSAMGLTFGGIMSLAGLIAVFGTLSSRSSGQPALETDPARIGIKGYWHGFSVALGNRAFRNLWLSFSLFFLAVVMNAALAIHFFTWYVEIIDSEILSSFHLCFYLGAMVGVVFWIGISKRMEKRGIYLLGMFVTAALLSAATLLFGAGNPLGVANPVPLFIGSSVAGFFASVLWVLPSSMLADIADQDELTTGLRREGLFFGILNFGEKIAAGIAILLSGALVEYFVRLDIGAAEQTPLAAERIGLVYGVLPASLILIGALMVLQYRLNRKYVAGIQKRLQQQRTATESSNCLDERLI